MRRPVVARFSALVSLSLAGAAGCGGCDRRPPEPEAAEAAASASAETPAAAAMRARHPRDDAGHLIPRMAEPRPDPSATAVKLGREPDWDLDPADPARDYVRRYATATRRYGETLACVTVGASEPSGDRRRVTVTGAPGCPGAGEVRDVFVIDVAGDRLSVDDRTKRDALAHWPDGSDPEGPASPVRDGSEMRAWQGSLKDVIRGQQVVPIRVQAYGRGSYPVVTLAGWHAAITPSASPADLRPFAEALCAANAGLPLAFVTALDRQTVLRIRCPAEARWDTL